MTSGPASSSLALHCSHQVCKSHWGHSLPLHSRLAADCPGTYPAHCSTWQGQSASRASATKGKQKEQQRHVAASWLGSQWRKVGGAGQLERSGDSCLRRGMWYVSNACPINRGMLTAGCQKLKVQLMRCLPQAPLERARLLTIYTTWGLGLSH